MHAVLTEKEQATVDSIIHHHLLQDYPSAHHRYAEAKKDLVQVQVCGQVSGEPAAYDAAVKRFVIAFGV